LLGEVTKVFVARSTKANGAALAAHFGHRTGAGKGLDVLRSWKTLTIITELGEESWGKEITTTWERHKDVMVGMLAKK